MQRPTTRTTIIGAAPRGYASGTRTDVGNQRKINEDNYLCRDEISVWVVADGMGGHARGDVASCRIIDYLQHVRYWADPRALISDITDRLKEAHESLQTESAELGEMMGSTVSVLVLRPPFGLVIWAGDSRIFRLTGGSFEQLTRDHTVVQDLVDEGRLAADQAEEHPDAHVLTRAIGTEGELELDYAQFEISTGDRFLLCTDGLSRYCSTKEMQDLLQAANTPDEAAQQLVGRVLEGPAADNVTAIVVAETKAS